MSLEPGSTLSILEELFHSALELPPAERAAWLERTCGEEVALRPENAPFPSNKMYFSAAGAPGDRAFLVAAFGPDFPGSTVGAIAGLLQLDGTAFVLTDLGAVNVGGVASGDVPIPSGLFPGIELWFQSLLVIGVDQLRFADAPQQAWGF